MIIQKFQNIAKQSLELGKREVSKLIPSATGETVRSLEIRGFELLVRPFFTALTTGRGPSKRGGGGSGVLLEKIRRWARARGIPDEAVYPISKKIHNEGDQRFRGQKKGVDFSPAFKKVEDDFAEKSANVLTVEVVTIFDKLKKI